MVFCLFLGGLAKADSITWSTPAGTFQIPTVGQTRVFGGYDIVLKQTVAGVEAPFWQAVKLPDGSMLVDLLDLGAAGVAGSATPVQPVIGFGINLASLLKLTTAYKDINVGLGGRYATDQGRAGLLLKGSVEFGGY